MDGLRTSGMAALGQSMKVDRLANNVANASTPAYRRESLAFGGRLAGAVDGDLGAYNALAGRAEAPVALDVPAERGAAGYEATRRPLDLALVGEGWFALEDLRTGETLYTRAGDFTMNRDGLLTTSDGRCSVLSADGQALRLDPAADGKLLVREDGSLRQGDVEIGRLGITGFEDESRLRKLGGNRVRNEGSGTAAPGAGTRVEQGALEKSGVNPVLEMVEMIKAFRVLETNLEMVRLQDAALDRAVNDVGRPQR